MIDDVVDLRSMRLLRQAGNILTELRESLESTYANLSSVDLALLDRDSLMKAVQTMRKCKVGLALHREDVRDAMEERSRHQDALLTSEEIVELVEKLDREAFLVRMR